MSDLYRKRPVVIRARQWIGKGTCPVWARHVVTETNNGFEVFTLEGVMQGRPCDWIVQGVNGECYPVKPDIFAATYEPVEAGNSGQSPEGQP